MKKNIFKLYFLLSLGLAAFSFLVYSGTVLAQEPTPPAVMPTFNQSAYDAEVERIKKEIMGNQEDPGGKGYRDAMLQFPWAKPILDKYIDPATGKMKYDMSDPAIGRMFAEDMGKIQTETITKIVLPAIDAQYEQLNREAEAKNQGALRIEQDARKANLPNELIPIKATNYSINPREHYFYWFVDDVLQEKSSGLGRDMFLYDSPSNIAGKQKIKLITNPIPTAENQNKYQTQMDIRIADADLNYRGLTYVPADYKGKSNASVDSFVFVEAVPYFPKDTGGFINPGDLNYTWSYFGASGPFDGGVGRNSVTLKISDFTGEDISLSVDIEDMINKVRVRKSIFIKAVSPQIIIERPKEKKEISLNRGELSGLSGECVELKAVPYFFSIQNPTSDLDFNWTADAGLKDCSKEDTQKIPNIAYVTIPDKDYGNGIRSTLSSYVSNKNNSAQSARTIISFKIK
jgi:hypothetical protein